MAKVHPFRGFLYDPEQVGDLNKVVTQPYDKIDGADQERYYESSPYNIVRVILPDEERVGGDRYQSAADNLQEWIDEGVLVRDQEPSFYAYFQEYEVEGETHVRRGFVGLGDLGGEEKAKAHEDTMEGPKADRLNLMRATEANFGHIFMLYSDPQQVIADALEDAVTEKQPAAQVKDEDRNLHRLWRIGEEELLGQIRERMQDKNLYIADGHHRYETAINFMKECLDQGWKSPGPEGFTSRMMTFINIDDPGLTILPTHRMIYGLEGFNPRNLLEEAREDFAIYRFQDKESLFEKLDQDLGSEHTFGYRAKGGNAYWALSLNDESLMDDLIPDQSPEWRKLDVSILHKAILERYLGIDEEALEKKTNIDYVRYRDQALSKLENESYQAAFLLNPTRVEEVKAVADNEERMPQKSTDFYPKLLTGLVMHKLEIDKE
ncbi:MAG: DUF1015 domain-containing protein [Candidatus Acetothermia bacterium]